MSSTITEQQRVWIYQSNRALTPSEEKKMVSTLSKWLKAWLKKDKLTFDLELRYHHFIILTMDEERLIELEYDMDQFVDQIRKLQDAYNIDLFDRMSIAFRNGRSIEVASHDSFRQLAADGQVGLETIVYNNLVDSKEAFDRDWEVPLEKSWYKEYFAL